MGQLRDDLVGRLQLRFPLFQSRPQISNNAGLRFLVLAHCQDDIEAGPILRREGRVGHYLLQLLRYTRRRRPLLLLKQKLLLRFLELLLLLTETVPLGV